VIAVIARDRRDRKKNEHLDVAQAY